MPSVQRGASLAFLLGLVSVLAAATSGSLWLAIMLGRSGWTADRDYHEPPVLDPSWLLPCGLVFIVTAISAGMAGLWLWQRAPDR